MFHTFNRISKFVKTVFSEASAEDHALKLREEAQELHECPLDIEEAADCFISLVGVLSKNGYKLSELLEAVNSKMDVLEKSEWIPVGDGTYKRLKVIKIPAEIECPHCGETGCDIAYNSDGKVTDWFCLF